MKSMSEDIGKDEGSSLEKKESEVVSIKKSTLNKLIGSVIVVAVISAFLGGYILGAETSGPSEIIIQDSKVGQTDSKSPPAIISVSLDDDPVKGDPNAPITIVEFSDYQCPFCEKFFSDTLPLIQKNFVETGKVKFVYRDFPIPSIHPNAIPAAVAAECADDQGMFWQYHDKLFENQKQWENLDNQNVISKFEQFSDELGLDSETFNNCLESGKYLEEVQKDLNDGVAYGVTGTPGFFIGNEKIGYTKVSGAQPYASFEKLLEQLLSS